VLNAVQSGVDTPISHGCCTLTAIGGGQSAAKLAVGKLQLLTGGKRGDEKHQVLKADARVGGDLSRGLDMAKPGPFGSRARGSSRAAAAGSLDIETSPIIPSTKDNVLRRPM
jgi:hypothetical protein